MNWQPIETAPRDGTEILVIESAGGCYVANWQSLDGWVWAYDNMDGPTCTNPTHWMPLPEPPKE